jgi:hypothetical protein
MIGPSAPTGSTAPSDLVLAQFPIALPGTN